MSQEAVLCDLPALAPGQLSVSVQFWDQDDLPSQSENHSATLLVVEQPSVASIVPPIAQLGSTSQILLTGANFNANLGMECLYKAASAGNASAPEVRRPVSVLTANHAECALPAYLPGAGAASSTESSGVFAVTVELVSSTETDLGRMEPLHRGELVALQPFNPSAALTISP